MKKKIFTFFLALVASVGTVFADNTAFLIGDLYYFLDATNQTAAVARYSSASGEIIIPSSVTYNSVTYSVTSIGYYAFEDCSGLTSVTIPNSVTIIGYAAFSGCTGLTSVTIPNSVISIGGAAFSGCSSLTSLTIPNSVTSIGNSAFAGCGLTSVTIPNGVISIGDYVFDECTGLTSVTIPNSVTSIGIRAFYGCRGLTSVTIPNSVTSIGYGAFWGCGLTSIVVENENMVYDSRNNCNAIIHTATNTLIAGCKNTIIPNSVTSIGEAAFAYCTGLTSVTIPNSVTSIGEYAFFGCTGLTSVTIPNSVTSIGEEAFFGVLNIVYKGTAIGSPWGALYFNCYVDGYLVYSDDTKTKLLKCSNSAAEGITIPNSVTTIGEEVFYGCTGLTSVTIPNSVTYIGDNAFKDCSGLTSVTIPNSVTSIGYAAFYGCTGLTSVTIGNSVTSIGSWAFYGCSNLKNVIIGSSVKVLEDHAFYSCSSIETITCYSQRPPTVNQDALYGLDYSTIVYVPADYLNNYVMHDAWGLYDVRPLGAKSTETTDVNVTPAENTAEVAWPAVSGAATYELVIKDKSGNVICTLIFNAQGQLTQIVFNAPSRDQVTQQTQAAGFSFTVTGLENGTSYDLTITSKDNNGGTLDTKTISFTTTGESQGIEDVLSNQVQSTKVVRNGQILILRGEKEYTVTGQEVR